MDIFFEPDYSDEYRTHPLTLVDVGAAGGLRSNWLSARKYLRVIGFDPSEHGEARSDPGSLRGTQDVTLKMGLYRERARLPFYLTLDRSGSSLYRPNEEILRWFPSAPLFGVVGTVEIEVDSLDSQLKQHGIEDADFIKLDTQGSELTVLEGAERTLPHVFGLEVEVEFVPIYSGQPLFGEVDDFLRQRGFLLYDLKPCYWKRTVGVEYGGPKGELIWAHALYLRDVSHFLASEMDAKGKLLRAVAICVLYGYHDLTLELLLQSRGLGFSDSEVAAWRSWLQRRLPPSAFIPNFPGRRLLAKSMSRIARWLEPTRGTWISIGKGLGNIG